MNILITHNGADLITHKMLGLLSRNKAFHIYVALSSDSEEAMLEGECIPLRIPKIKSKFSLKVIKAIRKIIKDYDIDITFSPSTSGLSNSLFASIGTKVKNIGYRGTQAKVKRIDPTYRMALLNPRAAHIVCETDDIKEYLSKYIPAEKLSAHTKPFDTEWVADAIRAPKSVDGIPDDAFKCIYIGISKNRPFKGLTDLIKAFQILNDANAHLTIIGEYGESDFLLAQSGPHSGNFHFLGNQADAVSYIPNHDLFILPSHRDASPRVVREAMACSVPCIVTDIPGARDLIVNNVSGLLVPPHSPEKMADAIRCLINDNDRRKAMAEASRIRVINDFSVADYVSYFDNLFSSFS